MNRSNTKPGVRDGSGRYLRGPRINSLSITRKRPDSDSQAQTHLNIRSTYKFHLNSYEISHKFQGKRAFSEAPHESIKIQASMKSTRIVLMQRLAMSEYPTNTNGQQSEKKKKKLRFAAWKRQRSSANCSRSRNRQCGAEKTQLAAVGSSVPSICFPIGTWPTRLPPARKARCRVSTNSWPKQITLQIQIRTFSMVFC